MIQIFLVSLLSVAAKADSICQDLSGQYSDRECVLTITQDECKSITFQTQCPEDKKPGHKVTYITDGTQRRPCSEHSLCDEHYYSLSLSGFRMYILHFVGYIESKYFIGFTDYWFEKLEGGDLRRQRRLMNLDREPTVRDDILKIIRD